MDNIVIPYKDKFSIQVWCCFVFLLLIKLFLVSGQKLYAITGAWHDDRLFINIASNLLEGNWLGHYNNLTLSKGFFYPCWIAGSFISGIPLLFSEHLLYALACLIFVIALKPIITNKYYLVCAYAFLLFNPVSYANHPMTRVIREGIYCSQTIIIISCTIGLLLSRNSSLGKTILWSVFLGISLSSFWLTREEGVWILPLIFCILGYNLILIIKNYQKNLLSVLINKILVLVIPFMILGLSIISISTINYLNYKIFTTVEFKSNSFLKAYGALTRIKHKDWKPDVPVPKETRMRIYEVSPSFSELKPYLEGSLGEHYLEASNYNEIRGGWFMWALRDAVAKAGYYTNGATAKKYYQRLADEINWACDNGKLEFFAGERATMIPPWHNEYIKPLLKSLLDCALFIVRFDGIDVEPSSSVGNKESMSLFVDITREHLSLLNYEKHFPLQSIYDGGKINILAKIQKIYAGAMPILILLSTIVFFLIIALLNRETVYIDVLIISVGLVSIFVTRIGLLSLINISSFSTINILYLSPVHPVMISLVIVVLSNTQRIFKSAKSVFQLKMI